jgi:FKBP-type peptidyl-prolyl cis-trans isomerase
MKLKYLLVLVSILSLFRGVGLAEGISVEEYLSLSGYSSQIISGTSKRVWYRDLKVGNGKAVSNSVVIRYWDGWLTGQAKPRKRPVYKLIFRLNDPRFGKGIRVALGGMKVGGRREVFMEKQFAQGLKIERPQVVYFEMELLNVR